MPKNEQMQQNSEMLNTAAGRLHEAWENGAKITCESLSMTYEQGKASPSLAHMKLAMTVLWLETEMQLNWNAAKVVEAQQTGTS